jgi:hypothetical protein
VSGYKERLERRKQAARAAPREKAPYVPRPPGHGHATHVCTRATCERYRSPLEIEISEAIAKLLKEKVPAGARAVAGSEPYRYTTPAYVRLVCSGSIPILAYSCCMEPNHQGQCYSANKNVHFTAEVF